MSREQFRNPNDQGRELTPQEAEAFNQFIQLLVNLNVIDSPGSSRNQSADSNSSTDSPALDITTEAIEVESSVLAEEDEPLKSEDIGEIQRHSEALLVESHDFESANSPIPETRSLVNLGKNQGFTEQTTENNQLNVHKGSDLELDVENLDGTADNVSDMGDEEVRQFIGNLQGLLVQEKRKEDSLSLKAEEQNLITDSANSLEEQIILLEKKLIQLEKQVYEPTKLVDPLIPLIIELLRLKARDSREALLYSVIPIIDRAIQKRTEQNRQSMSAAIAAILPSAISQQIQTSPEEIAKAIAPELAAAIREQIRLSQDSLSEALAPEMGRAIKKQVALERDAMVDALYPVIGNTISKYMVEAIRDINAKVENALSPEGIQRKFRAKIQGVSEAELILQESMRFKVQAVFLIQKASGLVIREVQPSEEHRLESDMLAGMLTAIRSFVNDCVVQPGEVTELNEIEYGDSKIILEVAGYCYLAVIVKGEPSKKLIRQIRDTLAIVIQTYGQEIQDYEGDPDSIPDSVQPLLENLIEVNVSTPKRSQSPITLIVLLLTLLGAIFIPLGILKYRERVATRLEIEVATALEATPELSIYRLTPEIEKGTLTLRGRVPSPSLRERAEQVASSVTPDLAVNNEIVAVEVPANPEAIASEVQRLMSLFNQEEGISILARSQDRKVFVEGMVIQFQDAQRVTAAFENIPGVQSVINTIQLQSLALANRIYFSVESSELANADIPGKIASVKAFLEQYPETHLRIIGHSDSTGTESVNRRIALERAKAVQQVLINQGVDSSRLHVLATLQLPPGVSETDLQWRQRTVIFEPFIPLE